MEANYYISKGQKVVGPCTLDDLYSYIAYGSVRDSDLVRREGATEWTQLRKLEELQLNPTDPTTSKEITVRRRTARYRDYAKVPEDCRAGVVLTRLIWGFLLFPPLLWKGAISVFQDRIYSAKTDERGYLLSWPRWIEPVVSGMLVLNGLLWASLVWWVCHEATPLARELSAFVSTSITDLQDWLGK